MTNEDVFKKLRNYHTRLGIIIKELETLEDFENADYSEIVTDIGYCTVLLEQRREQLQHRGRRL